MSEKATLDLAVVQEQASQSGVEASSMAEFVRSAMIEDEDSYTGGVEIVAKIKTTYKRIEAVRVSIVDPIRKAMDAANGFFKPHLANLLTAEQEMKGKLIRYTQEVAAKKAADLAAAAKAVEKAKTPAAQVKAAERVMAAIETPPPPKVEGMAMRTIWSGEVTDAALLPREYMIPDLKALLALTRAKKGQVTIPGWRAVPSQVMAVNSGGA